MNDDDDLWGPPFVVRRDSPRKMIPRGCEFWFDCRTDVLEENFQNAKYCEIVGKILNEKKQDEVEKDMASAGSSGEMRNVASSDSDKTITASLPDADTSSAKSVLDEDENTSSISDAQTIETRDSSNETEDRDLEARVKKPQETATKDPVTVEVPEDADISSSPVLAKRIEEAEEHSSSSLVSDQVLDPVKQASENKSSSAISVESIGGSTLKPLGLETIEKVDERVNATNKDGELSKDHHHSDSLQDIVTVSEPFTTESLLEMCDEPDEGREISCDETSKKSHPGAMKTVVKDGREISHDGTSTKSHPGAVKTAVKDELIINLLRQKAAGNALLNPRFLQLKKRQSIPNSSGNKSLNPSFIRNIKQKSEGEAAAKNSTQSAHQIIRGSNVTTQHPDSTMDSIDGTNHNGEQIMVDSVVTVNDLQNKTGKELRSIAKAWKIAHYYKLKKEELLRLLTSHLMDCTNRKRSHN